MKLVVAIIKPFKLDELQKALANRISSASPSAKLKVLADRRATRKFIGAPNI